MTTLVDSGFLIDTSGCQHSTVKEEQGSLTAFQYSQLPTYSWIRLLQLEPATSDEAPVVVSIQTCNLASAPTYRTLSYTWGDPVLGGLPDRPFPIIRLNGHVLPVTPNLFDALKQLRRTYSNCWLWIDAICINQEDLAERSAQVSMMQRIFRCATAVIVWLGTMSAHNIDALNLMTKLTIQKGEPFLNLPEGPLDHYLNALGVEEDEDIERTCEEFFTLQYFQRIWIVKEILVANDIIILTPVGHVLWEQIVLMAQLVGYRKHIVATHFASYTPKSPHALALPALSMARTEGKVKLSSLVAETRGLSATDPRDKVFALLSLVFDAWDELQSPVGKTSDTATVERPYVDYTLTIAQTYERCSRYLMRQELGWYLLSWVGDSARNEMELPSWVPDYSRALRPRPLKPYGDRTFTAGSTLPMTFKASKGRLQIAGMKWDTVAGIAEDYDSLVEQDRMTLMLRLIADLDEKYIAGGKTIDALWRTMIAYPSRDQLPASASFASAFRQQFLKWTANSIEMAEVNERRISIRPKHQHRHSRSEESIQRFVDAIRITPSWWRLPVQEPETEAETYCSHAIKEAIKFVDRSHPHTFPLLSMLSSSPSLMSSDSMSSGTSTQHLRPHPHLQREELFSRSFQLVYKDRRLFRTKKGYLGIGPAGTRPGDTVFIIAGARVPFVCRHAPEPEQYHLIGEAFVNGIMHGEPFSQKDKEHELKHYWLV